MEAWLCLLPALGAAIERESETERGGQREGRETFATASMHSTIPTGRRLHGCVLLTKLDVNSPEPTGCLGERCRCKPCVQDDDLSTSRQPHHLGCIGAQDAGSAREWFSDPTTNVDRVAGLTAGLRFQVD